MALGKEIEEYVSSGFSCSLGDGSEFNWRGVSRDGFLEMGFPRRGRTRSLPGSHGSALARRAGTLRCAARRGQGHSTDTPAAASGVPAVSQFLMRLLITWASARAPRSAL